MKRQAEQKQQPRADRAENRINALNDMPKAQMREQQTEQAGKPQPHGETPRGKEHTRGRRRAWRTALKARRHTGTARRADSRSRRENG